MLLGKNYTITGPPWSPVSHIRSRNRPFGGQSATVFNNPDDRRFVIGVQWHAEYDPQTNPVNRALFEAFGGAVNAYVQRD